MTDQRGGSPERARLLAKEIASLIPGADPDAIGEDEVDVSAEILARLDALAPPTPSGDVAGGWRGRLELYVAECAMTHPASTGLPVDVRAALKRIDVLELLAHPDGEAGAEDPERLMKYEGSDAPVPFYFPASRLGETVRLAEFGIMEDEDEDATVELSPYRSRELTPEERASRNTVGAGAEAVEASNAMSAEGVAPSGPPGSTSGGESPDINGPPANRRGVEPPAPPTPDATEGDCILAEGIRRELASPSWTSTGIFPVGSGGLST